MNSEIGTRGCELSVKKTASKVLEPDVTVKEDLAKVALCRNGRKQVLPKTPAVARVLRSYERMQDSRI